MRGINGQWVMVYSEWYGGGAGTRANCIGWATAPTFSQTFTAGTIRYCSSLTNHGFFDTYLFVNPVGAAQYLLWSEEWPGAGNSEMWIQPLSSDGLTPIGTAEPLLTFDEAVQIENYSTSQEGIHPFVENPSLTTDPDNSFDLTFSLGTYNESGDYITGEVACLGITPVPDCSDLRAR